MATVYPSASGNWSDTSLWMEVGGNPYNQIPQEGDVVYLNGCTMNMNIDINLGTNGEIRNDGDDGQGISVGGCLYNPLRGVIITANIKSYGDGIVSAGYNTSSYNMTFNGNIDSYGGNFWLSTNTGTITTLYWTVVGNINNYGNTANTFFRTRSTGNTTINITGNIYSEGVLILSNCQRNLSVTGDITGNVIYSVDYLNSVVINGDVDLGSDTFINSYIARLTINGNFSKTTGNFISSYITTFNMNGTLTQGQGQIASYITTLNLDGTLNLSGTRPFTYGVQTLNVATGGRVTFDNHLYYCFSEINHVDSNFEITCRNQNLDNFTMKNKSVLATTYPAQQYVADDYVYGLEDEFEGTYPLPDPANVLEGTHYANKVGTLTLDISSQVQSTIDDLEDTASTLLEEQPPLVKTLSASAINNTSATITLSTQNTGATTTKTGIELDTDWMFSNPLSNEVNNVVNSVSINGLTGGTNYYARAYVVDDGRNVYSNNIIPVSTLLIPSELQLCEYIETDGSAYIITNIVGNSIVNAECKVYCNAKNKYIFKCQNGSTSQFDLIVNNDSTAKYTARLFNGNTATKSNINMGVELVYKFDRRKKTATFNTQVITFSHNPDSYNNTGLLYLFSPDYTYNGLRINYWKGNAWNIVSTYIKSGETYTDNKGNSCSAGTAGFYDIINQIFYTNDGGGNFTHGNDII